MKNHLLLAIFAISALPVNAYAGDPVPLPLAGATGPVGLGIAALAYCGYRLYKRNR